MSVIFKFTRKLKRACGKKFARKGFTNQSQKRENLKLRKLNKHQQNNFQMGVSLSEIRNMSPKGTKHACVLENSLRH